MAKKASTSRKSTSAAPKARTAKAAKPTSSTEVRNTAIPKPIAAVQKAALTHDMIARRAYEIYASGQGGSDYDNWCRAERELRAELGL